MSFRYDPETPLIQDLSLVAAPGQTVAIVGPTGAGKTTLVNLIMRFYELSGGRITLDGTDIAQLPRAELRSKIGMVLQDTWLFHGSIRDNIAYGRPDATDEQIRRAAEATYVDRFVRSLPDGYDTMIDEEASNVSAGEKQLLTIARAFLAEPSLLILDEATSSVDTRTELLVQHAMAALRSDRTSFVIAHRLSTIRDADLILVMEHGEIVEQGKHEQLLAAEGAYFRLYNAQFAASAVDLDSDDAAAAAVRAWWPRGFGGPEVAGPSPICDATTMRKYVIMGVQGSGKGTQGAMLARDFDLTQIAVGDIFRWHVQNHTKLGAQVRRTMADGRLVDDDTVEAVVRQRLVDHDWNYGFIVDGFPRNARQAEFFLESYDIDGVIHLDLPDQEVRRRVMARRLCSKCGMDYNLIALTPKVLDQCDVCGGQLVSREDDTEEALANRLRDYHTKTNPVLELFRRKEFVVTVDARPDKISVQKEIRVQLGLAE